MEIKIAKGAFERTVSAEPTEWPQASQAAVITIGLRNLPKDAVQWTRDDYGIVTVRVPQGELFSAGLHSMLNDAHASVKFGSATGADLEKLWNECNALADKRLAGLVSGQVRAGGGGKRLDDETRRAREIAERKVLAKARVTGKKFKTGELPEHVKEYYGMHKTVLHELAAVELRDEAAEAEADLAADLPTVD